MYCIQHKTFRERKRLTHNSGLTGSVGRELLPVLSIQADLKNNRALSLRLCSMYLSVCSLLDYCTYHLLGIVLAFNLTVADSKNSKL